MARVRNEYELRLGKRLVKQILEGLEDNEGLVRLLSTPSEDRLIVEAMGYGTEWREVLRVENGKRTETKKTESVTPRGAYI